MRDAFTQDARFIYRSPALPKPLELEGIDAVMGLFEDALASQTDQRRHAISTHLVERENKRKVKITSYLTLLVAATPSAPPVVQRRRGVYQDTLVLARRSVAHPGGPDPRYLDPLSALARLPESRRCGIMTA